MNINMNQYNLGLPEVLLFCTSVIRNLSRKQNNNNNNNSHNDIYSAVIIAEPLREFTRFTRPLDQANQLEPQARLYKQPVKRIHNRHLLS